MLKSAGLESLLKSKNSIGDRNPLKRVSCTTQNAETPKSSAKIVPFRSGDLSDGLSHRNTGTLWCARTRITRAREVFVQVGERDLIEWGEDGVTDPERFENFCDA